MSNGTPEQQPMHIPSRWEMLAREKNSRVVVCHAPDTFILTDLARAADRAVRSLRNRIFITLQPEDVSALFNELNEATLKLDNIVERMSEMAQIKYKRPRSIARLLKARGGNGGPDDSADKTESD